MYEILKSSVSITSDLLLDLEALSRLLMPSSMSPLLISLRPFPKLIELINLLKLFAEKKTEIKIKNIENIGIKFFIFELI